MFNFLNGIPVVGHAKGLIHYATGNVEEGNKAMKESTRSSVVMGAGAVGFVAGPVGSAAMGAVVGAAWDGVETIVTNEPKGYIKGIDDIVETASKGKVPIGAIFQTTVGVAADAMGGLGGGSLANTGKSVGQSVAKSVGKSVATKSATKEVTKTVIVDAANVAVNATKREIVKEAVNMLRGKVKEDHNGSGGSGSGSSSTGTGTSSTGTGSGSSTQTGGSSTGNGGASSAGAAGGSGPPDPPRQNPNNNTCSQQKPGPFLADFLIEFAVRSLQEIQIRGVCVFTILPTDTANPPNPQKRMRKILGALRKMNDELAPINKHVSLKEIRKAIEDLFETVEEKDITYLNFISFLEFIMQFLYEWATRCNESPQSCNESRKIVDQEFSSDEYTIYNVFQAIRNDIQGRQLPFNFRDIYTAVYHYFKHRLVGNEELSTDDYFKLIRDNSSTIMNTEQYRNGDELTFRRYYSRYQRWLNIGVGVENNRMILRTAYFRSITDDPGEEGEQYIAIEVDGKEIKIGLPKANDKTSPT